MTTAIVMAVKFYRSVLTEEQWADAMLALIDQRFAELREKEKHMVGISVSRDPSRSTVTLCDGDRVPRDLESAINILEWA
jgi:hypothetical protein